jgi:hypothetical protein
MPSIKYIEVEYFIQQSPFDDKIFKVFVETGTHYGNTVINMSKSFNEIHTIELSESFYLRAKNKFINDKNINLYLGDSSQVLPEIIKKIHNRTIFFLDGHYSSGDTAQGDKDCPLIEELKSIYDYFLYESIIIIDDFRLFGTNLNEDWTDITEEKVISTLKDRVIQKVIKDDRLVIYLGSKIF